MIKTETITVDGRELTRTWSDAGRYVVRDGVSYGEAIDPAELGRTYTEGEIMPGDEATAEELLEIIVGGTSE
jgi:hypothetical protein